MKKRLFIFSNGQRSTAIGNAMLMPARTELIEEIDLADATEEEFNKIRGNPHEDIFLKKVKDKIRKDKL